MPPGWMSRSFIGSARAVAAAVEATLIGRHGETGHRTGRGEMQFRVGDENARKGDLG